MRIAHGGGRGLSPRPLLVPEWTGCRARVREPRSQSGVSCLMHPADFIRRPFQYAKRHGVRATINRVGTAFHRARIGNWHVLFYCDLAAIQPSAHLELKDARVERKNSGDELSGEDLQQILSAWNPQIARRRLAERFAQGAVLWLCKLDGRLAAYGWTIIGRTMERHFMPLGGNDVHLFDFLVVPEFRGRRINPALVNHILSQLAAEGRSRAFIEAAVWNTAQLASLGRTLFRPLGRAWKCQCFGRTLVMWSDWQPIEAITAAAAGREDSTTIDAGASGRS